MKKLSV